MLAYQYGLLEVDVDDAGLDEALLDIQLYAELVAEVKLEFDAVETDCVNVACEELDELVWVAIEVGAGPLPEASDVNELEVVLTADPPELLAEVGSEAAPVEEADADVVDVSLAEPSVVDVSPPFEVVPSPVVLPSPFEDP